MLSNCLVAERSEGASGTMTPAMVLVGIIEAESSCLVPEKQLALWRKSTLMEQDRGYSAI